MMREGRKCMKNCEQVKELPASNLDNALAEEEHHDVAAHLRYVQDAMLCLRIFVTLIYSSLKLPRVSLEPTCANASFPHQNTWN